MKSMEIIEVIGELWELLGKVTAALSCQLSMFAYLTPCLDRTVVATINAYPLSGQNCVRSDTARLEFMSTPPARDFDVSLKPPGERETAR